MKNLIRLRDIAPVLDQQELLEDLFFAKERGDGVVWLTPDAFTQVWDRAAPTQRFPNGWPPRDDKIRRVRAYFAGAVVLVQREGVTFIGRPWYGAV